MKIVFTVNLAIQYSLLLNQQQVTNRLVSFVHFAENGTPKLPYYAEHGHFEPSDRSKYKDGLGYLTPKELLDDHLQPRRPAQADKPRAARPVNSILHPGAPAPVLRRR